MRHRVYFTFQVFTDLFTVWQRSPFKGQVRVGIIDDYSRDHTVVNGV